MNNMEHITIFDGFIGNGSCLAVDGECLHRALEVKRDFAGWLKKRIADYHFVEGQDFVVLKELDGDKEMWNHLFSLGMAKELCILEKSATGRELRRKLIEAERRRKLEEKNCSARPPSSEQLHTTTLNLRQHLYKAGKASRDLGRKRTEFHNNVMAVRGIPGTPHCELLDQIERSNEMTFRALDDLAESIARNMEAMRILTEDLT